MLKSKIAMALAAAMVMATLYGCSSSDSGLKNDLADSEDMVSELQGKLDAVAEALGIEGDPTATDVEDAVRDAMTDATAAELQELATALDLTVPADATRQQVVDAITDAVGDAAGPVDAFVAAEKAKVYAAKAVKAVADATEKSGMLLTMADGVGGNSQAAVDNAQAVLDAQDTRNAALPIADAELAKAEAVVDEDAEEDDHLNNALMAAVEAAETEIETANAKGQGTAIKAAVAKVENPGDPDPAADPVKTPADAGYAVATDIAMALVPTDPDGDDGSGARHMPVDTAPPAVVMTQNKVVDDDHQGMTWGEIVGEENIMEMRLGTSTPATDPVMAASVAGMTLTTDQPGGDADDGVQVTATYMGIGGTAFCQGDCSAEVVMDDEGAATDDRKLVGDWFFTPDDTMTWYIRASATDDYMMETLFARFGHWLTMNQDGDVTVNTYAMSGVTENGNITIVNVAPETTLLDEEATYTGNALGMAIQKMFGTDGEESRHSGPFEAMVTLTAPSSEMRRCSAAQWINSQCQRAATCTRSIRTGRWSLRKSLSPPENSLMA